MLRFRSLKIGHNKKIDKIIINLKSLKKETSLCNLKKEYFNLKIKFLHLLKMGIDMKK